MPADAALAERREQIAGDLAEWLHAAAREAQLRLMAAESTAEFNQLADTLCKLGRGVRQSLLVHARLEGERRAAERKLAAEAAAVETASRHRKRARVQGAICEHIGREDFEDEDDFESFEGELYARLDDLQRTDDFLTRPLGELVAEVCRDMGFEPPGLDTPEPAASDAAAAPDAEPLAAEGAANGTATAAIVAAFRAPDTS